MLEYKTTLLDRHFARFIADEARGPGGDLEVVALLLSNVVGNGNICLGLEDIAGRVISIDGNEIPIPSLDELITTLSGACVVGSPGQYKPLVLDAHGRLYLYRYWKYERDLARVILDKAALSCPIVDEKLLGQSMRRLFTGKEGAVDWQKVAALAALRRGFCAISGGPGTGKTSTVVRILALILELSHQKMNIALAAPTGKSAARLKESISVMKENLNCADAFKEQIPHEVSTIHRLLGAIAGSVHFRHCSQNPLPYDLVVVDEASMVPLPLMAKLALALKPQARLIILGDRNQLASVEAGAVLGDICGGNRRESFTPQFLKLYSTFTGTEIPGNMHEGEVPPLVDSLIILQQNYRFSSDSGIGVLAQAVNAGMGPEALALLEGEYHCDIAWRPLPKSGELKALARKAVLEGYGRYLGAVTAREALQSFDTFRILCAQRQGQYGVTGFNALVEEILVDHNLIDTRHRWYRGRPIMITVNDYNLKLFNGDVGIAFPDDEGDGGMKVFFPTPGGGIRTISPVRLPPHETVFAMTIHKSQGSEFDHVVMVLPESDLGTMTRELIYTGITRSKKNVAIWADQKVFIAAVSRRVVRTSGLRDALWAQQRNTS